MPLQLSVEDATQQIAYLQGLMREADAEWDELTRLIQTDEDLLSVLARHLDYSRRMLALQAQQPSGSARDLTVQVAALQQQLTQLEQFVALETVQRNAVMGRFDQARLVLATVRRRTSHRQRSFQQFLLPCRKLLFRSTRRVAHELWSGLLHSGQWCPVIPPDQFW